VPKKTIRHDALIKKLKKYGIIEIARRGKGSHRMLYQESTRKDYPIKFHGKNTEYSLPILKNIMRKFNLPDNFLD
jgi:predicted RNA binding protein YcfA (HicA-like mRNA interferase family)